MSDQPPLHPNTPVSNYITLDVAVFPETESIKTIKDQIVGSPDKYKKLHYLFFTSQEGKLTGVSSLHKFLEFPEGVDVRSVMHKDVVHCNPHTSLERAVAISLNKGIIDIPVVDHEGRFKGVLTSDTLLRMANQLFAHKAYAHAGIVHNTSIYDLVVKASLPHLVWARLPWLVVGTFGGALSAQFVGFFETTLEQNLTLALFIPAIVYMSDAVGTQTETLFIRTLALREVDMVKYILRDFFSALSLGGLMGLVLGALVYVWRQDLQAALIIGLSMLANTALASPIALAIPSIFRKLGKDPALGSGPLATIIQDLISLMVYFSIAVLVLRA